MREDKVGAKKRQIILLSSVFVIISLILFQGIYYLRVFLSQKYHVGKYVENRKGTVQSTLKDENLINSKVDINGYSFSQVVRHFKDVALRDEGILYRDVVRKWAKPVRFYAEGDVDLFIREVIEELFVKMNSIEGFPGIYEVDSIEEADLVGYFYDDEKFFVFIKQYGGNKFTNGLSLLDTDPISWEITNGVIAVRNGMTDARRRSVICEELVQAMGLQNDTLHYPDSLFYKEYNEVPEPNELDWIIFKILYHPLMQSGLNYDQCIPVLAKIIEH